MPRAWLSDAPTRSAPRCDHGWSHPSEALPEKAGLLWHIHLRQALASPPCSRRWPPRNEPWHAEECLHPYRLVTTLPARSPIEDGGGRADRLPYQDSYTGYIPAWVERIPPSNNRAPRKSASIRARRPLWQGLYRRKVRWPAASELGIDGPLTSVRRRWSFAPLGQGFPSCSGKLLVRAAIGFSTRNNDSHRFPAGPDRHAPSKPPRLAKGGDRRLSEFGRGENRANYPTCGKDDRPHPPKFEKRGSLHGR